MTLQHYNQNNQPQVKNFNFQMPVGQEMQNLIQFCTVMADTPFYKKLGAGGVLAVYLTAKERNLPFMSCLNGGMHPIEGKITYSGGMVGALILSAGHTYKILSHNDRECEILFTRGDGRADPLTYKYTMADAQIAGYLTKDNWKKNPKAMMYNRALTGGARMIFPEIMMGVLVYGELVGTNADGNNDHTMIDISEEKPINECVESAKITTPKDIENFKNKYEIGNDSDYDRYLKAISEKCNKPIDTLIASALSNIQGFEEAFANWLKALPRIEEVAQM